MNVQTLAATKPRPIIVRRHASESKNFFISVTVVIVIICTAKVLNFISLRKKKGNYFIPVKRLLT